jgi:hypothetical protein
LGSGEGQRRRCCRHRWKGICSSARPVAIRLERHAADGSIFQLLIEVAGSGVVKLPGCHVNTSTGQVTSTFANNPGAPFTDWLQLRAGCVRRWRR